MLNAGQSGFVHAPVSKTIIAAVVLMTVFASIIDAQPRFNLNISAVISQLEIWRLFTHNFVFTTPGELLFGMVLLYFFRQFERQLGSSRFAAFAFVTSVTYTVSLAIVQLFIPALIPSSGPYSLVFASLVFFFFETPKIYHFQMLGAIALSDKSFAYLLVLQLLFSSPPRSVLSCAAGLAAGLVYRIPLVRDGADTPDFLVSFCSHYVLPLLGTSPRPTASRGRVRRFGPTLVPITRRGTPAVTTQNAPVPISESHVETLVAMGFSQEQSISALQRSQNDIQRATEMLLSTAG